MNAQDFAYWIQGYFEISIVDNGLAPEQCRVIKDHLALVFDKVTPTHPYKTDTPIAGDGGGFYVKDAKWPQGPEAGGHQFYGSC